MFRKSLPLSLHWHEGMFLQPQHFQQQGLLLDDALTFRSRLLSPLLWGFHRYEIDQNALTGGRLVVSELEAVFEDGLVLQTGHLAAPLERDLKPFRTRLEQGETLAVQLAVPKLAARSIEIEGASEDGSPVRYLSWPAPEVADATTGTGETPIHRLKINARLLLGDEEPIGYEVLPLAEIVQTTDVPSLSDYIPPTVLVLEDSPVATMVRRILREVRDTAGTFAGRSDPTLEERFQVSRYVASLLPLEQMVDLDAFRPIDFYLALCRLIGELSPLASIEVGSTVPKVAPPYEHDQLRRTFERIESRIRELLSAESEWEEIPVFGGGGKFDFNDRMRQPSGLTREHLQRSVCFAVKGSPRGSDEKLNQWVQKNCVIGLRSLIRTQQRDGYLDMNVVGTVRELIEPPSGLRLPPGYLVYRLDPNCEPYKRLLEHELPDLCFVRRTRDEQLHGTMESPELLRFFVRKEG